VSPLYIIVHCRYCTNLAGLSKSKLLFIRNANRKKKKTNGEVLLYCRCFLPLPFCSAHSPTGPRSTLAPGQIPSPRGKKAVQMPHPLLLKYFCSKTNFVFNQTLFTLVKERYAVMTPSNFIKRPLSPLSTNKGEILPWKSVKPCKNRKISWAYYARTRHKSGSNFPPFQGNDAWARCTVKCPGGMLKLQFDCYINGL